MSRASMRAAYWTTVALALSGFSSGAFGPLPVLAAAEATPDTGSSPQVDSTLVGQDATTGTGLAVFTGLGQNRSQSDLTLGNFFVAGWDDDYALRTRATGTPDFPLLRVQTNELLRLFRANVYEQVNVNSPTRKDLVDVDGFIDWSFNRRFEIELDEAYQWADARAGHEVGGGFSYAATRAKLFDTEGTECTFLFKVTTPNPALSINDTMFTYGLTGFEDLAYWCNLDRVGLYYSFVFDTLTGPGAATAQRNDVQYDISVAKTITGPDAPIFRMVTLFEENFAQTILDGPTPGRTYVTITPGIRFNLGTCDCWKMGAFNAVILGVDLPITSYQPFSETWRLSYIKCF